MSVRGEEFLLVEQASQNFRHTENAFAKREQACVPSGPVSFGSVRRAPPNRATLLAVSFNFAPQSSGQLVNHLRLDNADGEQRN